MKNLFFLFSVLGIFAFIPAVASATVGGPTYISSIAYKAADNALYYQVHDNGGRGCPAIIHRIDLATLEDTEVKSCSQVEKEFLSGDYEVGMDKYNQFIADVYGTLSYTPSVSLSKNDIKVDVEFLSEHKEDGYTMWSEFKAIVSQSGKAVGSINFRGCAKDQPHLFEGYHIPDSDKIAILISNKGDCFEGGYVRESAHVLKGITYRNTDPVRDFKEQSATEPNQGNVLVYAGDKSGEPSSSEPSEENGTSATTSASAFTLDRQSGVMFALTFIALFLGAILGYILGKKTRTM